MASTIVIYVGAGWTSGEVGSHWPPAVARTRFYALIETVASLQIHHESTKERKHEKDKEISGPTVRSVGVSPLSCFGAFVFS